MATWGAWKSALGVPTELGKDNTVKTYSKIKNLGLQPVIWESYDIANEQDIIVVREACRSFIEKNKPCLFIYTPKVPGLKKDFLFGIDSIEPVDEWINNNRTALSKYHYLITTQVFNHGRGYVGSVFSDGNGNMLCETMHRPGVSNQRELSQPKEDITPYLDAFTVCNHEIDAWRGKHLMQADVRRIIREYEHLAGYFEFIYGKQAGNVGIVTNGYEEFHFPLTFPEKLLEEMQKNTTLRAHALVLK